MWLPTSMAIGVLLNIGVGPYLQLLARCKLVYEQPRSLEHGLLKNSLSEAATEAFAFNVVSLAKNEGDGSTGLHLIAVG